MIYKLLPAEIADFDTKAIWNLCSIGNVLLKCDQSSSGVLYIELSSPCKIQDTFLKVDIAVWVNVGKVQFSEISLLRILKLLPSFLCQKQNIYYFQVALFEEIFSCPEQLYRSSCSLVCPSVCLRGLWNRDITASSWVSEWVSSLSVVSQ